MKTFLSFLILSGLAFADVQKNASLELEKQVSNNLARLDRLINPGESFLNIKKESLRCSAGESFEDGTHVGACIFEATGKSYEIDLLFVVTVKNPIAVKNGMDNWLLSEVSRHED